EYDAQNQRLTLHLSQSTKPTADQSEKKPFYMPVRLGLLTESGEAIPVKCSQIIKAEGDSGVIVFNEVKQSFTFEEVPQQPVVSLFRGFSAPVKVKQSLSQDALKTLMIYDTDSLNRWDASQSF